MADYYTEQDRTQALLGIYQVAKCVYDIATTGKYDDLAFKTAINSLFIMNPDNTLDVYGGDIANLQVGVSTLLAQMGSSSTEELRNLEITRYAINLITLERSVHQADGVLGSIAQGLSQAEKQRLLFDDFHENVIASLANVYAKNVSELSPRIMVKGQHGHLQNTHNANKIRALLLAGIRSAILWRQCGGSRWKLLWSRKKILRIAQSMYRPKNDRQDGESLFRRH